MSQAQKLLVSLATALVLAVALGAYAYFGVFQAEKEELAAKDEEERLFTLDTQAVNALTVQAKGETTELVKEGGKWRIVAPLEAPADQNAVERLLSDLENARRLRQIQDEGDLRPYGLERPEIRVEARAEGDESAYLAVGLGNTFDSTYFVSRRPGQVAAASSLLKNALEKGTFDLREKKLIHLGSDEVQGIEFEGDTPVVLSRTEGEWGLSAPREGRADEKEVKALLRKLLDIRATAFPESASEDLGEPSVVLTLKPTEGEALTIRFWEAEEKAFAQVEGGSFAEIPSNALEPLKQDPEELYDQRIAPFDTDKVAKVEVQTAEQSFTLARTEEGWAIESPEEGPARRWKVNSGIANLSDLRPEEVLPLEELEARGLAEPERTIRLYDAEGNPIGAYYLSAEEDKHHYVRIEGKDAIYKVRSNLVVNVPTSLDDVREASKDEDS